MVARELANAGKTVKVIDRRKHIAGNCYDYWKDGEQKPYFNLNEKVPKGGNTASQDMMD